MSSDRGAAGYEYENEHSTLYAYDNPSANNDLGGSESYSFSRSRYQCGGGNPTFAMDTPETSSYYPQQQSTIEAINSLSSPYLRKAGDYSNYFSPQHNNYLQSAEALKRPTTLEVCII